jgi:hypothetical protein
MGIYDYSVERPDGTMQPLSTYEEKGRKRQRWE